VRTPQPGIRIRLLALALAALALLPPDGWALCVAPGGHVEVEPATQGAAGTCCDDEAAMGGGLTAADGGCSACTDLVAFAGHALPGRHSIGPATAAAVLPDLPRCSLAARPAFAPPARLCPAPPPGVTILRN
jgi:hypothetical protein